MDCTEDTNAKQQHQSSDAASDTSDVHESGNNEAVSNSDQRSDT